MNIIGLSMFFHKVIPYVYVFYAAMVLVIHANGYCPVVVSVVMNRSPWNFD